MNNMKNFIKLKLMLFVSLVVLIPLGTTFYVWQVTKENLYEAKQAKFEILVKESEKVLVHRMDSYKQALLGGKGFYDGSSAVDRNGWKAYVAANDVLTNFPGINGIGTIYDVPDSELEAFEKEARVDGYPNFKVHPPGDHPENFVIVYIEPIEINTEAVGLNTGFEEHRREAAILSRDTGKPAITKRILLVQDAEKTPGFLLFLPMYEKGMPTNTIEERRKAFKRWIYAPFIGKNFMHGLTQSQGSTMHLQVYDEALEKQNTLIYDSNASLQDDFQPQFVIKRNIQIMQQNWLLVWSSAPEFERIEHSNEPILILISGLLFTGLLAVFVIVMAIRADAEEEYNLTYKSYLIPIIAFCVTTYAGYALHKEILYKERSFIQNATQEASKSIADTISKNVSSRILALGRMADRWTTRGGTPFEEWQRDAEFYVKDQPGLKTVEWVDNTYHVRWVEPKRGNEKAVGLNILFNEEREKALTGAAEKNTPTVTPPIDLIQGYKAFISYSPLKKKEQFDGYIVGVFGINELLQSSISGINASNFAFELTYNDNSFYNSFEKTETNLEAWAVEKQINIVDKTWTLKVYPAPRFIKNNTSFLPNLILVVGGVLGLMVALIIHAAQRSKIKSAQLSEKAQTLQDLTRNLRKSEAKARDVLNNVIDGIITIDENALIESFNPACEVIFGYKADEVIGKNIKILMPDPYHSDHDGYIENYKKTGKKRIIGLGREVRGKRKNGEEFAMELSVSETKTSETRLFTGIVRDITERRQMDKMKDEFISTVNHELRTPLTSIQTSLGLLKADSEKLDDDDKRVLELAYNNCERLTHLVNDILDIEKIAAGKMEYSIKSKEMVHLIQEIIDHNQGFASKHSVQFAFKSSFKEVYCNVDSNRFTQALVNLLSNAAKFSPEADTVTVSLEGKGKRKLQLSVSDNGPGIPKDFQSKIFSKFAQADSSSTRAKGGTGLGLNITKSIIEAFDGEVNFESEEGVGTTFYFILPISKSSKTKEV